MNLKKIELFLDSNATMKSYVFEEFIDVKEKFNSEHCVPRDNFLFDNQECISSIDQAFENLCEVSNNVSVLETLFGGSYKKKDNSTKLIERNMDFAAIILIQDEKLEKLRKFYFNLLEKYETQQIRQQELKEILSKKLNILNTSTIYVKVEENVDCSRNKSNKSSRKNFLPNLQSTLIEPEFDCFFLRNLLECRDFNMDGTPNMTKKYNRKKYLQQEKNDDGSRDMRKFCPIKI
ncbi:hypothetical protein BpHYR1_040019 [Brachionus plicatilis]|uniref:Uncharacterized protein n=1 Tax=Brachionus plicatilis TaxID=10195 RepID=A0A3M7T1C2_BRAPC|nr:hypothetical protein BpHYR1_040019 [Brachionus plicatilis]